MSAAAVVITFLFAVLAYVVGWRHGKEYAETEAMLDRFDQRFNAYMDKHSRYIAAPEEE